VDDGLEGADGGFTAEEGTALAEVFPTARSARLLLIAAGFPVAGVPHSDTSIGFWEQVSESLGNGLMPGGRHRILAEARRRFPGHRVFMASGLAVRGPGGSARVQLRVLVVGASPTGQERIRADREARAIVAAAETGHLLVEFAPAAQATDLQRVLAFRPDILHLACHGDGEHLLFEDLHGEEHWVPAEQVAATLRLYRDHAGIRLRGLVLDSCYGAGVVACFAGVVDRMVTHRGSLDDGCAVTFAGHLYQALRGHPDLALAARLAAQHTLLADQTCTDVVSDLVVVPNGERG
jgi:hypothetical protein